ncbi:S8 family peptidase [Thermus igniterrae]|uniref:S8 family peptidase n=1 Tax=Thermus igniterrae TaxID=88189 RepID=UPI0003704AD6|nr:S8 family peptidase [Thermus igniterrae]
MKTRRVRLLLAPLLAGLLGACGGGSSSPPPPPPPGGDHAPAYVEAGLLVLPPSVSPQGLSLQENPQARLLRRALAAKPLGPGAEGRPSPQAVKARAYLAVAWAPVPQAQGYRLYLRLGEEASWTPIGEVGGSKTFAEGSFALTFEEGNRLQLGVAALGPWGEGPVAPAPPLQPLAPPVPQSPRDGEDFPQTPLFRWTNSPRAEATGVLVASKTQEDLLVAQLFEGQVGEWRPQEPLPEGVYLWYALNFGGRTRFQSPDLTDLFGTFNVWSAASGGEFSIGGALRASISGTIRLVGAGTQAQLPEALGEALAKLELRQALTELLKDPPPMRPDRVILRLREGVAPQAVQRLRAEGFVLEAERPLALKGVVAYRLAAVPQALVQDPALPLKAALAFLDRPDVVWAQPDYIQFAQRVPNDPLYPFNWNYDLIGMPRAWDITVGSPSVVVGVVDSGVLWDPLRPERTHPDLVGQVLGGYDFISDPALAADGDGRDPDPYDTGPGSLTSYHGSHVGGIIGAVGDNGVGIPGMAWRVKQVHARALGPNPQAGTGTGSSVDIVEGLLWVAGLPVPGVPQNPHPAQIVNLSLGSRVPCAAHPFYRDAIPQLLARGVIVVVAAANSNEDASQYSPASCPGVITVGAVGPRGTRASYSNYGLTVAVMAPGGDIQGNPRDGVLSLSRNDTTGEMRYEFADGTSMATPHVTGLVALMKSLKPSLTPQEARAILQATASPMSAEACRRPTGAECGAGLVNAPAALQALGATPPPPVEGGLLNTLVAACPLDQNGNPQCTDPRAVGIRLGTTASESPYVIPDARRGVPYAVIAWKDVNGNRVVDAGDLVGTYPNPVVPPATGVDFTVSPR